MTTVRNNNDSPATPSPAYVRMRNAWQRCRDLATGTDAVRANAALYVPKHARETAERFKARTAFTEVFNAYKRTVAAMAGFAFRSDPMLEDAPPEIAEDYKDLDGAGTAGPSFYRRGFVESLTTGRVGILVEMPPDPNAARRTLHDELTLGIRPYWALYRAEDIISWRMTRIGSRFTLSQLVLRETSEVPNGAFGSKAVTRYRVLRREAPPRVEGAPASPARILGALYEAGERGQVDLITESEYEVRGVDEIPFALAQVGDVTALWEEAPPLLDLADVNLAHFAISCDRRSLLRKTIPVPVRVGYTPPAGEPNASRVEYGIDTLLDVPMGGDFKFAEITGAGLAPMKEELDDLIGRMAALGFSFLQGEKRAAETAEAKRIDKGAQNASLATAVVAFEAAINRAWGFHAQFRGAAGATRAVLNRRFDEASPDAALIEALNTVATSGNLSLETFLAILERWNMMPEDFNVEEEIERILKLTTAPNANPNAGGQGAPDTDADPFAIDDGAPKGARGVPS